MIQIDSTIKNFIKKHRLENNFSEQLTDYLWEKHPELEKKFGPSGWKKCLDDVNYILAFLQAARENSSDKLFINFIQWFVILLESLGISSKWLKITLELLREKLLQAPESEETHASLEILNKTIADFPESPQVQAYVRPDLPYADLAKKYLDFLLKADRPSAWALIENAVKSGIPVKDIYLHVFQPVMYEIGKMWQINQITPAVEHYCTAATQLIMSQLYPYIFRSEKKGVSFVSACVPGELHELGTRMAADLMELEGWDTHYFGANTPAISLIKYIKNIRPRMVGISCTIPLNLSAAKEIISLIRLDPELHDLKVIVGGNAFRLDEKLYKKMGADYLATDASQGLSIAASLIN